MRPLGKMEPAERSVPMLVSAAMGAPNVSSAGLNARLSPPPIFCACGHYLSMCPVAPAYALHARRAGMETAHALNMCCACAFST